MENNKIPTEYINSRVVNIKSEILFREAEDDFFYFNNTYGALKKLKEALKLTPCHLKSLILAGDISFIRGCIKKAYEYYFEAYKLSPNNPKIFASLANCYNFFENYEKALSFCENALNFYSGDNYLFFVEISKLKISLLLKLNKNSEADKEFRMLVSFISSVTLDELAEFNFKSLTERIRINRKIAYSSLRIIR